MHGKTSLFFPKVDNTCILIQFHLNVIDIEVFDVVERLVLIGLFLEQSAASVGLTPGSLCMC